LPALSVSLLEPIWALFSVLLPDRPPLSPTHPLGCHRRRIPDRIVFENIIAALVHGSGYERIASPGCSDRTIRRRVHAWADAGLTSTLYTLVLDQYDRLLGLDLSTVVVDGCLTKAQGGGETAGKSQVDRGKQGLKRSMATDATGVPLHLVFAGANVHDTHLLRPTLKGLAARDLVPPDRSVAFDRGYDSRCTRATLAELGLLGHITSQPTGGPVPLGERWVVERTHAWMNDSGRCDAVASGGRGRRLLPLVGGRHCHRPAAHSARASDVSLANPPDHQAVTMSLLPGALSFRRSKVL
jgi:transposase